MNRPIRVLFVEDDENDSFLVSRALRAGGFTVESQRVETPEAMRAALHEAPWDIVMSDYSMPKFSGPAALALLQESGLDIPFIVVSGTIGEAVAVQMMKAGVNDYMMKDQLARLVPAVQRELEDAEQRRERRRAEQSLRESEERFRQLAEHSSEGFWFVALNPERVLYVSPAVERIWGLAAVRFYEDAHARWNSVHPDDLPRVQQAWKDCLANQAARFEMEFRIFQPDGSVRWVLDTGTPIRGEGAEMLRISGVTRDITESKQVADHLRRIQRLESIGTLASGVAHDLNNALAPILMAAELIRQEFPAVEPKYLDLIQGGAKRGAEMVRQLLTFAKGAEGERLPLHSQQLFREIEKLIRGTFPKNIVLHTDIVPGLRKIVGDTTQLFQVLLNLCVNARDAMPEGGTLMLKAENLLLDAAYASSVPDAKPGEYVVWRVTDTGAGIPPDVLDRIFEPFFSTKEAGKGTGLGLSTVLGIIKGHGGFVRVYSTPGQGATFAIYLPAAQGASGDSTMISKSDTTIRGEGRTVLVVDDEAVVRDISRVILSALGFRVFTAGNGTEAFLMLTERHGELDVVITDLHMPRMDGLNFVRLLKTRSPRAGIIVASGRMEQETQEQFQKLGVSAYLQKPFAKETLIQALRTVLHEQD